MYKISRLSNSSFAILHFDEKKKKTRKNEETYPIFESSYLGNAWP